MLLPRDRRGHERCCLIAAIVALMLGVSGPAEVRAAAKPAPAQEYELKLRCSPDYLAGLPMVVEVELHNRGKAFEQIPFFDLVTSPSAVSFTTRLRVRTAACPGKGGGGVGRSERLVPEAKPPGCSSIPGCAGWRCRT